MTSQVFNSFSSCAGAHTIGETKCGVIHNRLYNNSGPDGVDPTLNATYAAELKIQCPFRTNFFKRVPMDPTNHYNTFDTNYFKNLQHHKGLFKSDAALVSNVKGRALVSLQTSTSRFFLDFGAAMEKMINTEILKAPQGEIRTNCRRTN
ncbi:hypothetical protein Mapa_001496 [Marchantia paleacea]|nr:hypothetical protein Mapa_001496 [Marchantia paleacea]